MVSRRKWCLDVEIMLEKSTSDIYHPEQNTHHRSLYFKPLFVFFRLAGLLEAVGRHSVTVTSTPPPAPPVSKHNVILKPLPYISKTQLWRWVLLSYL